MADMLGELEKPRKNIVIFKKKHILKILKNKISVTNSTIYTYQYCYALYFSSLYTLVSIIKIDNPIAFMITYAILVFITLFHSKLLFKPKYKTNY
jgi:hypothetical protein